MIEGLQTTAILMNQNNRATSPETLQVTFHNMGGGMKYRIDCVWENYGEGWMYRAVLIFGRTEYKSEKSYKNYADAERAAKRAMK